MEWSLEVMVVPVAGIDRARAFSVDKLGFAVDHATEASPGNRVVQLTPPGSGCSIVMGPDTAQAHAHLVEHAAEIDDICVLGGDSDVVRQGVAARDDVGFVSFRDPDGDGWSVQQISARE